MHKIALHPMLDRLTSFRFFKRRLTLDANAHEGAPQQIPDNDVVGRIKSHLIDTNALDVANLFLDELFSADNCVVGLLALLRKACDSDFVVIANRILDAAELALAMANDRSGNRPADVYRKFGQAVCYITRTGNIPRAGKLWKRYLLAQSLPISELDSPDFLDQYTGEVLPFEKMVRYNRTSTIRCDVADELGWSDDDLKAFQSAQEGFNAIEEEEGYDEYDVVVSIRDEMALDLHPEGYEVVVNALKPMIEIAGFKIRDDLAMNLSDRISCAVDEEREKRAKAQLHHALTLDPRLKAVEPAVLLVAARWAVKGVWTIQRNSDDEDPTLDLAWRIYKMDKDWSRANRKGIYASARWEVRQSEEAQKYLHVLRTLGQSKTDAAHLARAFLRFQHGLCFLGVEKDDHKLDLYKQRVQVKQALAEMNAAVDQPELFAKLARRHAELVSEIAELTHTEVETEEVIGDTVSEAYSIPLSDQDVYPTLGDWLVDYQDELLETLNDPAGIVDGIDEKAVETFAEQTLELYVENLSDPTAKDITRRPEFVRGYLLATFDAQKVSHSSLNEAGWESFRQETAPFGALAYNQALKAGGERKDAMRSFWRYYNAPTVRSMTPAGLVLTSGKKIEYAAAAKMLRGGYINIPRSRLLKLLESLKNATYGGELVYSLRDYLEAE